MSMSILSVNDWNNSGKVVPCNYTCGYCGQKVGSSDGYKLRGHHDMIAIYLCPFCGRPSFMENGNLTPGSPYGQSIDDLPETVQSIYDEARNSFRAGAYTGVILICRKLEIGLIKFAWKAIRQHIIKLLKTKTMLNESSILSKCCY